MKPTTVATTTTIATTTATAITTIRTQTTNYKYLDLLTHINTHISMYLQHVCACFNSTPQT